jgi:hypothetical protein
MSRERIRDVLEFRAVVIEIIDWRKKEKHMGTIKLEAKNVRFERDGTHCYFHACGERYEYWDCNVAAISFTNKMRLIFRLTEAGVNFTCTDMSIGCFEITKDRWKLRLPLQSSPSQREPHELELTGDLEDIRRVFGIR